MRTLSFLEKSAKFLLVISSGLLIFSFFQKDKLPDKEEILKDLYQEPLQTDTRALPFDVTREGTVYHIVPLYDYELYGLIVSHHHSRQWLDYYHKEWKDFINLKDLCVIWGNNVKTEVYKEMKFKSGSWTCYVNFKSKASRESLSAFKEREFSNNHLLGASREINLLIMEAQRGDQVYVKGHLVEYSHSEGVFRRGTSTTRDDHGCETIYVTDFKILKKANVIWRTIYSYSKYPMIICAVFLLIRFITVFPTPIKNYSVEEEAFKFRPWDRSVYPWGEDLSGEK